MTDGLTIEESPETAARVYVLRPDRPPQPATGAQTSDARRR
jgi:hypothetical protein